MKQPNLSNSANRDNLEVTDGLLRLPMSSEMMVPAEWQTPYAEQFMLGDKDEKEKFSKLLQQHFKKEILIWMIDKNWDKMGNCVIAVFYSTITKPVTQVSSGSNLVQTVGSHKSVVIGDPFRKKIDEKADTFFNEFLDYVKTVKEEDDSLPEK